MLIKTTNYCSAGCSHCLENSTVAGQHMTEETFLAALEFTARAESLAYAMGCPRSVLLSGGECTEHPKIVRFVELVYRKGFVPTLISNGLWLNDPTLRAALLRDDWPDLRVQVTHDPRYYPTAPPRVNDPRLCYVDSLTVLMPLGRLARKKGPHALPYRQGPSSFNLRSLARGYNSFEQAVALLRLRTTRGQSGHCIPTVSNDGTVVAGESRECFPIGTVHSSNEEITRALVEMKCNKCGLVTGLSDAAKAAIGEAP